MTLYERAICTPKWESDLAYEAYEQFIRKDLFLFLERAVSQGSPTTTIFLIRDEDGYLKNSPIGKVLFNEFSRYIENIPGHIMTTLDKSDTTYRCSFDTKELVLFYYEELQNLEYQTGKAR